MTHTCIKDDGGTPNRRCHACEAERPASPYNIVKVVVAEEDKYGVWTREVEVSHVVRTREGLVVYTK